MLQIFVALVLALVVTNGINHYVSAWMGKRAGIEQCEAAQRAAAQREAERQARAQAEEAARTRLIIEKLNATVTQLDRQLQENENEAAADPDAGDCGLSAAGSVRINKIR